MDKKFTSAYSYMLIYVFTIYDQTHKDCLKVGKATVKLDDDSKYASLLTPNSTLLNKVAKERINSYTQTAGVHYTLLYTELAERKIRKKNEIILEYFDDNKVHNVLKKSGIKTVALENSKEWFKTDLQTVKNAIQAVKEGKTSLAANQITNDHVEIQFRPEQKEAIEKTCERFKKHTKMLWNAKMRFGKTLSALEVIKRMNYKRNIILTHRPVVDEGWHEDFNKIFYGKDYYYLEKGTDENIVKNHINNNDSFVYFASIQDLRGSDQVGGKFVKNKIIYNTNWDLVIVDEAHEGTRTSLGDDVLKEIIKEEQYGKTRQIYLSGTPFNLVNDFEDDEVYTWDYVMEQKAKKEWDILHGLDSNPYEGLPKLSIYTYDIANALPGYEDLEDKAFNFREFFRVWTGYVERDGKKVPSDSAPGKFVHEEDVKSFLNLLCKMDCNSNYPFSLQEYRAYFNHTLWMLPGVKEAAALAALLKEHKVFGLFDIVNVAGEVPNEKGDPLERVNNAITEHPETTHTITLSCGRLTTGVSVKSWTAVLMLSGSQNTSASMYLQTIFRVQTPANINGQIKDRCYVFDFAPDRTLQMVAEAGKLGIRPGRTNSSSEEKMREFLNFCPVIAIQGSKMLAYDVNSMLRQLKRYYAARVAQNGFDDAKLYNDKLLKLTDIDKQKFEDLKKIVGESKASTVSNKIVISESGLGPEEQELVETAERKKKQRKELTEQEKEALEKLKEAREAKFKAISILRAISIRIPLLVYGAQKDINEDITIDHFAELIDDESWKEFMPAKVTKEKFNQFIEYYDKDIFVEAGNQIRRKAKAADNLTPVERVKRIAEIFSSFKNPDKETVLTPWRVVNLHMSETLGGWDFFDEKHSELMEENPRFVSHGDVTEKTLTNTNAKILEINSKSGLYPLYVAFSLFQTRLQSVAQEDRTTEKLDELWKQTLKENVFVLCKTEMAKYITKRTLLGYKEGKINAHYFEDLVNQFRNKSDQVTKKIDSRNYWNLKPKGNDTMKFDAVVGNPPYQVNVENREEQPPVYHYFYNCAFDLAPRVTLISPARFLFDAGKTPSEWNHKMLDDKHLKIISYYPNSRIVFPTVEIKGGVAITYRDKTKNFGAIREFIPDATVREILDKVLAKCTTFLSSIVYSNTSYKYSESFFSENPGFSDRVSGGSSRYLSSSVFDKFPEVFLPEKPDKGDYAKIIGRQNNERTIFFFKESYLNPPENYKRYKVFLSSSNGSGTFGETLTPPFLGEPNEGSTETFITIGCFETREEANNLIKYISTKFLRLMLNTKKVTQGNKNNKVWSNVPLQDFTPASDIDWTKSVPEIDQQLYKKYNLSPSEISFIETKVLPMP